MGRGTIRFNSFKAMKIVAHGQIFRSLAREMSCLTIITQTINGLQISELIDIINELHIPQKYLIIFAETLNTTYLSERLINIEVMIYNVGKGINFSKFLVLIND